MKNINTLKNAIHPDNLGYSEIHVESLDNKNYEFFKLDRDGYVYVTCLDTDRCTRYNGEGQNGKRISKADYDLAKTHCQKEAEAANLDAAAENPEISLEQFVELVQEAEESAETEQIEEVQREMAPKTIKRPKRISKDIAYSYVQRDNSGSITLEVTLTAKQVDFIRHLPDTYFWERGLDSQIWCDVLAEEIGGQFAGKPMTTGAMLSTICEKGLGTRCKDRVNGRKCTSFALTELGKIVAAELGLH